MRKNKLALLGGGKREIIVANELIKAGYDLCVFGLLCEKLTDASVCSESLTEALTGARGVILPVAGIDAQGHLATPYHGKEIVIGEADFDILACGTPVFCGAVTPYMEELALKCSLNIVPMMGREDVAVANAVPTAEGAMEIAIRETECTVDGSISIVCGYGRCGKAMAKLLAAMGSNVTVFSRNQEEHRQARSDGVDIRYYAAFERMLSKADMLFNTVPALILDEILLQAARSNCVFIDLASLPGGIDFEAAENLGLKVFHALGLPEKCAPVTAGEILANAFKTVLPAYLDE